MTKSRTFGMENTTTLHISPSGGFVMFTENVSADADIEKNYPESSHQEHSDWEFYPDTSF